MFLSLSQHCTTPSQIEQTPHPPSLYWRKPGVQNHTDPDTKLDQHRKRPLLYCIQWAGYEGTLKEFSWLIANELRNMQELVAKFYLQNPNKLGPVAVPTLSS